MNKTSLPMDLEAALGRGGHVHSEKSNKIYGRQILTRYASRLTDVIIPMGRRAPEIAIRFAETFLQGYDHETKQLRAYTASKLATMIDKSQKLSMHYDKYATLLENNGELDGVLQR